MQERRRSLFEDNKLINVSQEEWVNFGLPSGLLWRSYNLGASSPEEYGLYYSWGNITGHNPAVDNYSFSTNNYANTTGNQLAGDIPLFNSTYDAATAALGEYCRMPTKDDFTELKNNTTLEWILNFNGTGVAGTLFTSKTDNTKVIFIPAGGLYSNTTISSLNTTGYNCSGTINSSSTSNAYDLTTKSDSVSISSHARKYGKSIRPVMIDSSTETFSNYRYVLSLRNDTESWSTSYPDYETGYNMSNKASYSEMTHTFNVATHYSLKLQEISNYGRVLSETYDNNLQDVSNGLDGYTLYTKCYRSSSDTYSLSASKLDLDATIVITLQSGESHIISINTNNSLTPSHSYGTRGIYIDNNNREVLGYVTLSIPYLKIDLCWESYNGGLVLSEIYLNYPYVECYFDNTHGKRRSDNSYYANVEYASYT